MRFLITVNGWCSELYFGEYEDEKKREYWKEYKDKKVKSMAILTTNGEPELCIEIKEKGIDALEEDLKMRNAIDLPLRVSKADLSKFSENVKYNIVFYIKVLMAVTMHDEFGFGNKRIKQMFKRFDLKAECLADDYTTWDEQVSIIAEECGIDMKFGIKDINVTV